MGTQRSTSTWCAWIITKAPQQVRVYFPEDVGQRYRRFDDAKLHVIPRKVLAKTVPISGLPIPNVIGIAFGCAPYSSQYIDAKLVRVQYLDPPGFSAVSRLVPPRGYLNLAKGSQG